MSAGEAGKKSDDKDSKERKALREGILRIALTSEARQRLANVKMVKPELAASIEDYVVQIASNGKLKRALDDDEVKQLLLSLQERKRDITIRRI